MKKLFLFIATLFILGFSSVLVAQPYYVTNLNDAGAGSLRQAILDANGNAGADIIFISVTGTISVTSGLNINQAVTIEGPTHGLVSVDAGGGNFQIFTISSTGTVTIKRLGIKNSNLNVSTATKGAGIFKQGGGTLELYDCTLSGNTFAGGGLSSQGGGIHVETGGGNLTIRNCTFNANTAIVGNPKQGGAIYYDNNIGTIDIGNSTFANNDGGDDGGAICINNATTFKIEHCTLVGNVAATKGKSVFANNISAVMVTNANIIDGNGTGTDFDINPAININGDYNYFTATAIAGTATWATGTNNVFSIAPTTMTSSTLQDYGGYTQNLLPNSNVRDKFSATFLATDQRGVTRTGSKDAGAHEYREDVVTLNTDVNTYGNLRYAINKVNIPSFASVSFNLSGRLTSIPIGTPLPALTRPIYLDGFSQANFISINFITSVDKNNLANGSNARLGIELTGVALTANLLSLAAGSDRSVIRGLMINRAASTGVNAINIGSSFNTVSGCYIGTDFYGTANTSNHTGINIGSGSYNWIGGLTLADKNLISGNTAFAVVSSDANNYIVNNLIGTTSAGNVALSNGGNGVDITGVGFNFISSNIISGNTGSGINLGLTNFNSVTNNLIGLNAAAAAILPNGGNGVVISAGMNNLIGGDLATQGNSIVGNGGNGIDLTSAGSKNLIAGNSIYNNGSSILTNKGINLNGTGNIGIASPIPLTAIPSTLTVSGGSGGTGTVRVFKDNNAYPVKQGAVFLTAFAVNTASWLLPSPKTTTIPPNSVRPSEPMILFICRASIPCKMLSMQAAPLSI
jgi:hypothetical protein